MGILLVFGLETLLVSILLFIAMNATSQLSSRALILPLGQRDRTWSFTLDPKEVLNVIGYQKIDRLMIWEILAARQGVEQEHFARVNAILTAVLVELRLSGWIEHEDVRGRVWYRRTINQSLGSDYPFSRHFLNGLRRKFAREPEKAGL